MSESSRNRNYVLRIQWSLAGSLTLVIVLFVITMKIPFNPHSPAIKSIQVIHTVSTVIPATGQSDGLANPDRPVIPIPVEAEDLLDPVDTEKFAMEDFSQSLNDPSPGNMFADGIHGGAQPRPVLEVIPDYPDELRRNGISGSIDLLLFVHKRGTVDSVEVIRNSTNSAELEQLAIRAALKSRYLPVDEHPGIFMQVKTTYEFSSR